MQQRPMVVTRKAASHDTQRESLFQLYRSSLRPHIEPVFGWDETFQRARVHSEYPPKRTSILLANSREVGFLVLTPRPEALHLSLLLIHPEFRSQGLGKVTVSQILRDAQAQGLPVTLTCFRSNARALRFYEELGFRTIGRDDVFLTLHSVSPHLD